MTNLEILEQAITTHTKRAGVSFPPALADVVAEVIAAVENRQRAHIARLVAGLKEIAADRLSVVPPRDIARRTLQETGHD